MKRSQALCNADAIMMYLASIDSKSYLTLEIAPFAIRLHYFRPLKKRAEVEKLVESLKPFTIAESRIELKSLEESENKTFDVIWEEFED